ncbi:MAG: GTP-binding protein, partial [Flavobacteriaceae bacterium]|nr:GTP-binding protein [Flavobacteriaceae bacterium]
MCGTCGCGSGENGVSIHNPKDLKTHEHHHHDEHAHEHTHDGHTHTHSHDHAHTHAHDHQHAHHQKKVIEVEQDILHHNDVMAARNRGYFEAKSIFALNLVSSPGSGKTSLLERTLKDLKAEIPFFVIEGDQQTMNDANRIAAIDIPVIQINTGKGCHLESDAIF